MRCTPREVHAYEMTSMRCMPMKCIPMTCTPVRCTPIRHMAMRCTPHEVHAREVHAREVHAHETLTSGGAVVDLSRSELAKTSFCASAGWSLWRAASQVILGTRILPL
jgi:hypothetical protein